MRRCRKSGCKCTQWRKHLCARCRLRAKKRGVGSVSGVGDDNNFPFVQKRFFDEYKAWTAVEQITPERFLASGDVERFKQMTAGKGMP